MTLKFDNHFEKLGEDFARKILPTPLDNQRLAVYSPEACELIGLDEKTLKSKKFLDAVFGNKEDKNFCYLAQAYAGHQFGHFVNSLGDGRAILLAQVEGKNKQPFDLVLKGSGKTPFSRPYVSNADGRAVLRSSIREFLASVALHHLGIPTSRALCLIASNSQAQRETLEPAAQIIRLSPSHIRFGTFEYFFYQKKNEQVKILANYAMKNYFASAKTYGDFLREVVRSTATMIAKWQAFGFCHGVMNTDNMSIHGITFDFGPFGFLDEYDPHHICNHSDQQGRYSFINQPQIGLWNLNAFAITLSSLIGMDEIKEILESYEEIFLDEYHKLMAQKLGFAGVDEEIKKFIYETLKLLEKHKIDYTNFFRNLSSQFVILSCASGRRSHEPDVEKLPSSSSAGAAKDDELVAWQEKYHQLLQQKNIEKSAAQKLIKASNPKFILRNYLLQNAISKAEDGDFSEVQHLQQIMEKPFDEQKENENYAALPPAWAKEICISCSS